MPGKPAIGIPVGRLQASGLTRKPATAIQKVGADRFDASVVAIGVLPLYDPEFEEQGVAA